MLLRMALFFLNYPVRISQKSCRATTIKSILNDESKNPGVVTIKKLCDGLEITLGEFFSTPEFDTLEQEIK